jgi:outer membrane protein TolC
MDFLRQFLVIFFMFFYSFCVSAEPVLKASAQENQHETESEMSLNDCIKIAKLNNPHLNQDIYRIKAAKAQIGISRSKLMPQVKIESGVEHFIDDLAMVKPRKRGDDVPYVDDWISGDLSLKLPVYTGKKLQNQIAADKLEAKSMELLYKRNKNELVFHISRVFYSILGQRELVNSIEFSKSALEKHKKIIEDLITAKKAAKVDLLRVEVRLADIKQKLIHAVNNLKVKKGILFNLMGTKSSELQKIKLTGRLSDKTIESDFATDSISSIKNRNDYASMVTQLSKLKHLLKSARAGKMPEVYFKASYGNRWAGKFSGRSEEVGQVGIVIDFPLFDGNRVKSNIRKAKSLLAVKSENLRELQLKISLEVKTALLNVSSTKARISVTQKAVDQAKESLRIEQEKYNTGKGTIVDVLDAQAALLESQTNYFDSLADFNAALAQYKLAKGEEK